MNDFVCVGGTGENGKYLIHYDGGTAEEDEWIAHEEEVFLRVHMPRAHLHTYKRKHMHTMQIRALVIKRIQRITLTLNPAHYLSFSLTHTHTYTHTQGERMREGAPEEVEVWSQILSDWVPARLLESSKGWCRLETEGAGEEWIPAASARLRRPQYIATMEASAVHAAEDEAAAAAARGGSKKGKGRGKNGSGGSEKKVKGVSEGKKRKREEGEEGEGDTIELEAQRRKEDKKRRKEERAAREGHEHVVHDSGVGGSSRHGEEGEREREGKKNKRREKEGAETGKQELSTQHPKAITSADKDGEGSVKKEGGGKSIPKKSWGGGSGSGLPPIPKKAR